MGLARDPIVKYRFQIVYPQNLDNIAVRGNFGGGAGVPGLWNQRVATHQVMQNLDFKELRAKHAYSHVGL